MEITSSVSTGFKFLGKVKKKAWACVLGFISPLNFLVRAIIFPRSLNMDETLIYPCSGYISTFFFFFKKIAFSLGGSFINLCSLISISQPWSGWQTREAIVQDTHSSIGFEPWGSPTQGHHSRAQRVVKTFYLSVWLMRCYYNSVWAIPLWHSHNLPASQCPVISLGVFCASCTSSLLSSDAGELAPKWPYSYLSPDICY